MMRIVITLLIVLFFYYPTFFYFRNFEEYGQRFLFNLFAFYSLGVGCFIFYHFFLKKKQCTNVALFMTIWVSFYPILVNYHYGKFDHWNLEGFNDLIESTKMEQKIEIFIFVLIFIMILFIKNYWKAKLISIVLVFIHITYFRTLYLESKKVYEIIKRNHENNFIFQNVYVLSQQKNILVFVPDMMSGTYFKKVIEAQPILKKELDGFTFFPNAIAVGNTTHASIHATQGGELGTPSYIMKKKPHNMTLVEYWQKYAPSFLDDFEKNGWNVIKVSQFANHYGDSGKRVTYQFPLDPLLGKEIKQDINFNKDAVLGQEAKQGINFNKIEFIRFASFMLFQASPLFIKQYIYRNGVWLVPNDQIDDQKNNESLVGISEEVRQYNLNHHYGLLAYFKGWSKYVNTSSDKPVIQYVHTILTHFPYYSQPDCSAKGNKYNTNSYEGNYNVVSCQILLFKELIHTLKSLKVYDQTMIIIASDHSNHAPDNKPFGLDMVFAVKPFGATGQIKYSDARVTNSDVPAIACEVIGNCSKYGGNNPFKNPKNQRKLLTNIIGAWPKNYSEMKKYNDIKFYEVEGDLYNKDNYQEVTKE